MKKIWTKKKIKPINSKNEYILIEDQKYIEKSYDSKYLNATKDIKNQTIIDKEENQEEGPDDSNSYDPVTNMPDKIKELKMKKKQKIIKNGTGIVGISYHKKLGLKKGGHFMACCVIGGLVSDEQILNAHEWALKNKFITKDNSVKIPCKDLAKKISTKYQTTYNSKWQIKILPVSKHSWVIDSKEKEVFNSAGLGARRC